MKKRIQDTECVMDHQVRSWTNKLMKEVGKLCLKLVHDKCYYLTEKQYDSFCDHCHKEISDQLNYDSVMSSVLSPEISPLSNPLKSYHFFHSAVQEYFAARFISNEFPEGSYEYDTKTNNIKITISKAIKHNLTSTDLHQ
jgi:hypothetical protein